MHTLLSQAEPSGQRRSHSGCPVSGQVTITLFTVTSIGKSNVQRAPFPIRRLLEYLFNLKHFSLSFPNLTTQYFPVSSEFWITYYSLVCYHFSNPISLFSINHSSISGRGRFYTIGTICQFINENINHKKVEASTGQMENINQDKILRKIPRMIGFTCFLKISKVLLKKKKYWGHISVCCSYNCRKEKNGKECWHLNSWYFIQNIWMNTNQRQKKN